MNTKRNQILVWRAQGLIKKSDTQQALSITESNNSSKQWFNFISSSLLSLSVISIAMGVIFFFAYNWAEMSTFTKFALLQGLILVTVIIYSQTQNFSIASTSCLFFLALLVGSLFALFGQTYQTGKDPWQLFFIWWVFVTPIAFISRSSSLWLLWLFLANISLNLILEVRFGLFGMLFNKERQMLLYALLGVVSSVGFEMLYAKKQLLSRIAAQVSIVASMVAFSWIAVYSLFRFDKYGFDLLFYLLWMMSIYYYYRVKTLDVLVLSSWVVSGIVFIVYLVGRSINGDLNGFMFLIFSVLTIGLSTLGGKWLMGLLKISNRQGEKS